MSQEKRLSLSFGDFACDIVGYDDPFTILNRVMELFIEVSKKTTWVAGDSEAARSASNNRFAVGVAETAGSYDLHIEEMEGRFVVTKREDAPARPKAEAEADSAEPDVAERAPTTDTEETFAAADTDVVADETVVEQPEAEEIAADAPAAEDLTAEDVAADSSELDDVSDDLSTSDVSMADAAEADPEPAEMTSAQEEYPEEQETVVESAVEVALDQNDEITVAQDAAEGLDEETAVAAESTSEVVADADDIAVTQATTEVPVAASMAEETAPEPQAEIAPPAPRRLRLNASVLAKGASDAAPKSETLRQRITVDTSRSRPYKRPEVVDLPKEAEKLDGALNLTFSLTPDMQVNAETQTPQAADRSEIEALVTRLGETRAANEQNSATLSDEEPLILSADDQTQSKSLDELDDDTNLFVFEDTEPLILEEPVRPAKAQMPAPAAPLPAPAAVAAQSETAPKSKRVSLGFSLFRRRKAEEPMHSAPEPEKVAAVVPEDSAFKRLQEAREAALPELEPSSRTAVAGAPRPRLFSVTASEGLDEASSPASFARQVGASSLQDLLEASAAYMAIVEGKAKFSRHEVMDALSEIGAEKDYSHEARLKSFRRLIMIGAIVQSEDGMFTVSHSTRYNYENQLRA